MSESFRKHGACVVDERGNVVAALNALDPDASVHGDLFAAAPDLLAALVDLMECDLEVTGPDAAECAKSARAAIAKARGGK